VIRERQAPVGRRRSRAFDAGRAVVLALPVALALLGVGQAQAEATSGAAQPVVVSSVTPDPTPAGATTPTSVVSGPAAAPTSTPAPTQTPTSTSTSTSTPSATTDPSPSTTTDPSPSTTTVPAPTASPTPTSTSDPGPAPTASATGFPSPTPLPLPAQPMPSPTTPSAPNELTGGPVVLATLTGQPPVATYLAPGDPVTDAAPFDTIRVRFAVTNTGATDLALAPDLQFRQDGIAGYRPVPDTATVGVPLHLGTEWVAAADGGTVVAPAEADIGSTDLRSCPGDAAGTAPGYHAQEGAPRTSVTIPAGSCTEIEFTVGLSIDVAFRTGYDLRLTDGGSPLTGAPTGRLEVGAAPGLRLSAGQRQGTPVRDDTTAPPQPAYPLQPGTGAFLGLVDVPVSRPLVTTAAAGPSGIHGPYAAASDECASCHSGHSAAGPNLLVASGPTATLCLTCHDGLGATTDVKTQYALARPTNNDATRSYYSHDALQVSSHTLADMDEMAGTLNRHSDCADCHNAHQAQPGPDSAQLQDAVDPTLATGWSASGRLTGVTGVSVTNGPAGTAPTYTFLNGTVTQVTHEYQLCFTCHSGYTQLPSKIAGKPSTDELDKAVELNPNNPSFHPVEAPGTNRSAAMQASLDGTSPYKLWNFSVGGTVRCLNCHASSSTPDTATDPGADLSPHTSANRGILIRGYRDRVLTSTNALYNSGDFALCYVCHAEAPFSNASGGSAATNFPLHGMHLTDIRDKGTGGTDIDTAGAGQGNAVCAECHFRIHSTADPVGTQQIDGTRLVSFAPNVQPETPGGTLSWSRTGAGGSCTLTCHGYTHHSLGYVD
jgi:predicted CXXCH cytochrome family protein